MRFRNLTMGVGLFIVVALATAAIVAEPASAECYNFVGCNWTNKECYFDLAEGKYVEIDVQTTEAAQQSCSGTKNKDALDAKCAYKWTGTAAGWCVTIAPLSSHFKRGYGDCP